MLVVAFFLIGELCHTTGFIDIPTVSEYDIPGMFGGGLAFSLPLRSDAPGVDPKDFTMVLRYGFLGRGELSLAMYTPTAYALSVSYVLKRGKGNSPSFFCGIDDISYDTHLSTIGMKGDDGFIEERNYFAQGSGRPSELLSGYIAMQQTFGSVLNLVIGLGRGRFVGYGERSHIFNTDLFVTGDEYATEEHSAWAFGVFLGGSIRFPFGLEVIAEMDGRDGNAGIKYHTKYVTPTVAITKVEHFWSPEPYSPRFMIGLETSNRFVLEKPKPGSIECVIQDQTSKVLLTNAVVDIKEVNKRYMAKRGSFTLSLPAGNYTLTVSRSDYKSYMAKISVKPGVKSKLVFGMKKTEEALRREIAQREKVRNISANLEKGKIYFSEGNLVEAKSSFETVLSFDPNHQEAKSYLAQIESRRAELISAYSAEARSRTRAKSWTKAIQSWKKVIALDSENREAKTAIANLRKALAPSKKPKKIKQPVAKKKTKVDIDALYNKGVSYFKSEKYTQALKVFNQVIALKPNHTGAKKYKKRTEARLKVLKGGG